MRVLMVNKFNYLKGGGAKYFLDLVEILRKHGVTVAKFSMQDEKNLPDENEKYFVSNIDFNDFKVKNIFRYISRILYSREAAKKFEKLIIKFKPDIIHLHNIYHQISPSILFTAKKFNIPIVMHLHDYKIICPNYKLFSQNEICHKCKGGRYYNCILRKCIKNSRAKSALAAAEAYLHDTFLKSYGQVDLFIAPSQFMKSVCVDFGIPEEKIKVVCNFVEMETKEKNLWEKIENYLLFFGRLSEEKGIDVLIRAMKGIDGELKLKIVGGGPEAEKLGNLVRELKLTRRVELTGPKFGKDLSEIITKAKAVVIPSVWPENMPLSMLEAMASGKVVLASRVGGMPEAIKDGENGFLFEPGNYQQLTQKINALKKINLLEIGEKARITVNQFNSQWHFKEIYDIYNFLLRKQNKGKFGDKTF
ncbi:MAG: glycosyltransferase [Candidatus Moranbacteria bacterium]|nr:glycosyltransferase [Candidatus Moranbacteria bacterium]